MIDGKVGANACFALPVDPALIRACLPKIAQRVARHPFTTPQRATSTINLSKCARLLHERNRMITYDAKTNERTNRRYYYRFHIVVGGERGVSVGHRYSDGGSGGGSGDRNKKRTTNFHARVNLKIGIFES
jgi:hypothetical protein